MNNFFVLFANCIPVRGSKISIICDLQNHSYVEIPNLLCEILTVNREEQLTIPELKERYHHEEDEGIDLFFDYLVEKGLGFYASKRKNFPNLQMDWKYPGQISNAIIEVNHTLLPLLERISKELTNFNCFGLELRIVTPLSKTQLEQVFKAFDHSSVKFILLITPDNDKLHHEDYEYLLEGYPRCANIIVHSSKNSENTTRKIIYLEANLTDRKNCGLINKNSFVINIKSFSEATNHNSCLNRKVAIDQEGNIRNCPSMPTSFGNIKETTLAEALEKPGFKKYWDITKDKILVCQDCQFRYICTDCRAYVEKPENDLSKPLKCGYNPYTGEWAKWTTNPLKNEAREYYGL